MPHHKPTARKCRAMKRTVIFAQGVLSLRVRGCRRVSCVPLSLPLLGYGHRESRRDTSKNPGSHTLHTCDGPWRAHVKRGGGGGIYCFDWIGHKHPQSLTKHTYSQPDRGKAFLGGSCSFGTNTDSAESMHVKQDWGKYLFRDAFKLHSSNKVHRKGEDYLRRVFKIQAKEKMTLD